ncbi:ABC transporter ATP-binding protein [Variovorax sp. YR216]|uniref:ABC transporter ATP-binding protein n=1 Tax=Variovorax sp. YR216 TaxID=1882828 RepID=UPI0008998CC4|nr:ABC transporter ATP-binding protein [Variovorax sp. YR216]SEB25557.1 carbohydrate ABC transporter ATP-binding protein, CUT1 family [Variovorax sp. YR216]
MSEIRVHHLHKAFADFTAVKDSSFAVRDGEFFCLLGPSGCGKTTTLRMIAGLELPTSGQIFLADEDVSFKRASERDIAFVFQMFALYPHMNVRRNIAFPLVSQGMGRAEIARQVESAAQTLRISHLLDKPVSQLSSGDRQRVALGRAIVRQPKAFLMDEPLGALDAEFRELMCRELRALHDRLGATTVYVTHDQMEAMAMADVIAVMNEGTVEQLGPPREVYECPASVFVADFIGAPAMNFLPFEAALARGEEAIRIGPARLGVPQIREDVSTRLLLAGVRPENVRLADDSALRAEVLGTEYQGSCTVVTLATAQGASLRAEVDAATPPRRGDHVGLAFDARAVSLFDAASGRALRTARDDALHAVRRPGGRHG